MFKVVPDQLKISDGWVRCGHCADVFDATLYLERWEAPESVAQDGAQDPVPGHEESPAPPQEPVTDEPIEPIDAADMTGSAMTVPMPLEADDEGEWLHDALEDFGPPVVPEDVQPLNRSSDTGRLADSAASARPEATLDAPPSPTVQPPPEAPDEFVAELARFAATSGLRKEKEPEAVPAAKAPEPALPEMALDPEPASEPAPEIQPPSDSEPGFVRQARRQAFWRSPGMRALQFVVALSLGLLLAVQWALHERDPLASRFPVATPWLAALCRPVGCTLQAPRRIDAVVIDSSTLVRRLGNFYSFDMVLKNSAPMAVAMPALELSLTNTADAVIARRVFRAEELPGSPSVVPAHGSLALSLRLSLADAGVDAMSGYRALVFYP